MRDLFRPCAFAFALLLLNPLTHAQCPGCAPDLACTQSPPYPTLCPLAPPDATVGVAYQADLTFWLPATFTDPGTGFAVTFQQMTITGISGLPFGMSIETSDPLGVYHPQQDEYGCARLCGTPLGAGTFPITIQILASVTFNGFTVNVPESFVIDLTVLPGSGGNLSFTFSPTSGCGDVTAGFQALIDGSPSPTTYAWDFGNGQNSTLPTPPAQNYTQPGIHVISLTTTIGGYQLEQVLLASVNDNWCGDVEEPNIPLVGCTGSPDLYFVLTDANGNTFTSNTQDNSMSATWNGLSVAMNNPPYSISFYDEDVISQDDLLGTYNIPLNGAGTYPFSVAGGTVGSITVGLVTQQVFQDSDTVVVYALPDMTLAWDSVAQTICAADTGLVAVTWFLDGDTIPGANGVCINTTGPGQYWASGTNGFGCVALSDTVTICPVIDIQQNGNTLFTASDLTSYQWLINGAPIPGANGPFVFIQGDGLYAVEAMAAGNCAVEASYIVNTIGMPQHGLQQAPLAVFPVPSAGSFTVVAEGLDPGTADLRILDLRGRALVHHRIAVSQGALRLELTPDLAPGRYVLEVVHGGGRSVAQVVLQ